MGCDIHLHVERRVPGVGWVYLGEQERLEGRNYATFAVLANVRNGRGFAGIVTGTQFNPISEPRGLPPDVTDVVREGSDQWGRDGHSYSWLSLRELLEYDYTQETVHRGVLAFDEFKFYDECRESGEAPQCYAAAVSGGNTVTIQDEEARLMTAEQVAKDGRSFFVNTTWKSRYLDDMRWFLVELIPYVKYGLDDVRLVFWFDN